MAFEPGGDNDLELHFPPRKPYVIQSFILVPLQLPASQSQVATVPEEKEPSPTSQQAALPPSLASKTC